MRIIRRRPASTSSFAAIAARLLPGRCISKQEMLRDEKKLAVPNCSCPFGEQLQKRGTVDILALRAPAMPVRAHDYQGVGDGATGDLSGET
jgi:hypothetical protein